MKWFGHQQRRLAMLYVIIADGEFDQVCETKAQAAKEKRDLTAMGCTVRVKLVRSWDEADELEARIGAGRRTW